MLDFEDQLRSALSRKPPPAGFARRIAGRIQQPKVDRYAWKPWAAGLIAASLVGGAWGIQQLEHRREMRQGQAARAQLLQALQITGNKLQRIQKRVESTYQ